MLFEIALASATLLCALVSGFLFGFAVVAMPGLGTLDDRAFVRAFQVTDRVIQDGTPLFMTVWIGSVVTLVATLVLGIGELAGGQRLLLVVAALVYLIGVQLPTAVVNIPLNNEIQKVDAEVADGEDIRLARERFETRWNRWNAIRTGLGCLASAALVVLLLGH